MSFLSKNRFLVMFFASAICVVLVGSSVIGLSSQAWSNDRNTHRITIEDNNNGKLFLQTPDSGIRAKNGLAKVFVNCNISSTGYRTPFYDMATEQYIGEGHVLKLLEYGEQVLEKTVKYGGEILNFPCRKNKCVYKILLDGVEVFGQLVIYGR